MAARFHPRDISSPIARAAMGSLATTTTPITSPSNSLLRRGVQIARSVLISPRCVQNDNINTCEKPALSTDASLGIMAAGGVVGFVIIIGILIMLHLRRNRVEKEEFAGDNHELSDWGLDDYPSKGGRVGGYPQQPGQAKKRRLSEHELTAAENPFGLHSDLATAEKMSAAKHGGPPPRYPDAVKM